MSLDVSQLLDGQLDDELVRSALRELGARPELRDRYTVYGIIGDTLRLRALYAPQARIAVLSNATLLHRKSVFDALLKVDDNIQKLDSAFPDTIRIMDCPAAGFSLPKTVEYLRKFKGKVTIQTMFIRAEYKGQTIDNTTDREIEAWIGMLKEIRPSRVMIYTIARDTPIETIRKIPASQLHEIANRVKTEGFEVQVSG